MWTSDLQVVVLAAGRGSRMTGLIGNAVPKCLVPVAGNPLIFYVLKSLVSEGFAGAEVLVIVQDREDIKKSIHKLSERLDLKIELYSVPEDSEDFGTLQSLNLAKNANKLTKSQFLVVSCDLLGDLPIKEVLKLHGLRDSSFTALYMKNFTPSVENKLPGPRTKIKQERDVVGLHPESKRLIFMSSEADLDEYLELPVSTLKKFPNFKLITWLTDCHLYVINKDVLSSFDPFLREETVFLSLKGAFIPWLIQNEYEKESPELSFYSYVEEDKMCLRVNSLQNYLLACQSSDWLKEIYPNCISRAKETKIGKSCKLVNVLLGDHNYVGDKCKLSNVITMDHVRIEPGCELTNVVLSSKVQIGASATLKDSLVGPSYQVLAGGNHTNEHLTVVEETFFEG